MTMCGCFWLQSDAENSLERLHEAAEKQANKVMEDFKTAPDSSSIKAFESFKQRLVTLTDVTRGYFAKLVDQLERGFNDLERDFPGGQQATSKRGLQGAGRWLAGRQSSLAGGKQGASQQGGRAAGQQSGC
ncbi:hypothetical protein QJQ45_007359 [Haematococcus lacustris]|nr:hypothetical protein QJQ45_007359 [Haematococcus lacustris]